MSKQVSRLSFILLGHLPVDCSAVAFMSVRPLHGYWGSPEFSSVFPRQAFTRRRLHRAQMHTLFICQYYSRNHKRIQVILFATSA